ncbi:MAG: hypothetical protein B1H03_06420 [Planctomycetales bacterium 4484_113]|nr:MAG: hypothetical protein B1H03_06420 [Planctomycetales bacterium 4484_113]
MKPMGDTGTTTIRRGSWKWLLVTAALVAGALPVLGFAVIETRAATTESPSAAADSQQSTDFKVLKWALPHLQDTEIEALLGEIELAASRYAVSYQFALAVVAAEASFPGKIAIGRRRNIDFLRLQSGLRERGYPAVQEDVENAISSLAMYLRTEQSTSDALTSYWADPELKLNTDSLRQFLLRVKEKYATLTTKPQSAGAEDYIRDVESFPPSPTSNYDSEIKQMPNLNAQLVRYDVEDQYRQAVLYFNPKLTDKGAMGLGQLMPATVRSHGIRDPFDPVQNIYVTVKYLEREANRWGNRRNWLDLVLASYNAGAGAVSKYGGVPPYNETIGFVRTVKRYYHQMVG